MKRTVIEKGTVVGKTEHAYILLDNKVGEKDAIGSSETRHLKIGNRYMVTMTITNKGVRHILNLQEIPTEVNNMGRKKIMFKGPDNDNYIDEDENPIFTPAQGSERFFPIPEVDKYYFMPEDVRKTLQALIKAYKGSNCNVFVVGPQGVGKTSLAAQWAAMFGLRYFEFQCAQVREPMDWAGRLTVRNKNVVFDSNVLISAVSTPNTVICLNEFNRVPTEAHNAIYEILSDKRATYFDEMKRKVRVAANVHFICTMNIGHGNMGTFQMDVAL